MTITANRTTITVSKVLGILTSCSALFRAKPTAWTNLTYAQLLVQVKNYSSNSIATFGAASRGNSPCSRFHGTRGNPRAARPVTPWS